MILLLLFIWNHYHHMHRIASQKVPNSIKILHQVLFIDTTTGTGCKFANVGDWQSEVIEDDREMSAGRRYLAGR